MKVHEVISCLSRVNINLGALKKLVCGGSNAPGNLEGPEEPQDSRGLAEGTTARQQQGEGKNKVGPF